MDSVLAPTPAPRRAPAILELPSLALGAVLLALLLRAVLVQVFFIPSASMEPTLASGDRVIVLQTASIDRGDVIVFDPPGAVADEHYIKRAIGLPGDVVEIRRGRVVVNGVALREPYARYAPDGPGGCDATEMPRLTVPAGQLFFLGDNRGNSCDSREIGTVAMTDIIGEAVAVLWPLNRLDAGLSGPPLPSAGLPEQEIRR
jgi:signal peptidase I